MTSRCAECSKKLSLIEESMGICRCKKVFCSKHKLFEEHKCTYDYKEEQRKLLQKEMPTIVCDKLNTI